MRARRELRRWRLGVCALLAVQALTARAEVREAGLARALDGRPNIQGVWTMRTLTPFIRPDGVEQGAVSADGEAAMIAVIMEQRLEAELLDPGTAFPDGEGLAVLDGEYRTSAIVSPASGTLPLRAAGKARLAERPDGYDGPEARAVNERCIADAGRAPYRVMSGEMFFQIIQTPDHLVIHKEGMDPPRIFSEGVVSRPSSWTGASMARWEGNALVIETTGFRADDPNRRISGPGSGGFPIRPETRITERIEPLDRDTLLYRYVVDDPVLYSEPLVVELPLVRTQDRLFESACHEGNASLAHTLQGARQGERYRTGRE